MRFDELAPGPPPQMPASAFARRRRELARRLGEGNSLVVATHATHQFSHDVDYLFRPHSDFWYLTGFGEPGAVLVLDGGSGASTLFLRGRKPDAEIWTGRRLGVERADVLGMDRAYDLSEMPRRLPSTLSERVHAIADHDMAVRRQLLRAAGRRMVRDVAVHRPGGPESKRATQRAVPHGRALLHDMRQVKDARELRLLQKACDLGVAAHAAAAGQIRAGGREYAVDAAFTHHARRHGSSGVGYPSICGAGKNAAVLHYVTNLSPLRRGELFLIDAGCEWGYYTSDITRTYAVGGALSRRQGELYELVRSAHHAAMKQVRPGRPFRQPHDAAVRTLTAGLIDLGLLKGRLERAIKDQSYRRFFMHGTSHFLGLDVHDAGSAVDADGKPRRLREGMVLTIEPGLYFNPDFAKCPSGTAGIGIRIEDDVAVTESGRRNLTEALPTEPEELARLMRNKA